MSLGTTGDPNDPSTFHYARASFFSRNPTSFLTHGINNLLTTYIPQIVQQNGSKTTLVEGNLFTFSITNVKVYNSGITPSDCFKHRLTYRVPIVGDMTLTVAPLLSDPKIHPPVLLSKVRSTIFSMPIPTGTTVLTHAVSQDRQILNRALPDGIFITDGRMRTIPWVKSMFSNMALLQEKKKFFREQVRSSHDGNRTLTEGNPFRSTSSIEFEVSKKKLKREVLEGVITCKLPFSKHEVHIGVLAQAFGCEPQRFVQLIRQIAGNDYDEGVFRPYEISILYHEDVVKIQNKAAKKGKPLQEIAIRKLSKLSGKELSSTGINLLKTEVFPHLNVMFPKNDRRDLYFTKLFYLAVTIMLEILLVAGKLSETSRDLWQFANAHLPSFQLGTLVRTKFIKHINMFAKLLRRQILWRLKKPPEKQTHLDLAHVWAEWRLTHRIKSPIHSGNFSKTKSGVSIALNDNNEDAMWTQLLRGSSSMSTTDSVNTNPRKVQNDCYGYVDPAATPEGEQVGLATELACTATITTDVEDPRALAELLELLLAEYLMPMISSLRRDESEAPPTTPPATPPPLGPRQEAHDESGGGGGDAAQPPLTDVQAAAAPSESVELLHSLDFSKLRPNWFIYINHCGVPTHFVRERDVPLLVKAFREHRRQGTIFQHCFISVRRKPRQIRILCEGGQLTRPLIVLDRLMRALPTMSFHDMVAQGIVEWVTPAEEQSLCKVAVCLDDVKHAVQRGEHKQITHMEFTQASFVGFLAGSVVFLTGQQGPRLALYWHQKKQSMTAEPKVYRGSIMSSQTWYPHKDLIYTELADMVHGAKDGRGAPCMVVILTDPRTQEDAIKFQRQALERGLGMASTTRNYTSDIAPSKGGAVQKFERPQDVLSKKNIRYDAIGENGLPSKRQKIAGGEVVIGKTHQMTRKANHVGNNHHHSHVTSPKRGAPAPTPTIAAGATCSRFNVGMKRDISQVVPKSEGGQVVDVVEAQTPVSHGVRVEVQVLHPLDVGDKLTTDKGQKGVVGERCSAEDMPFVMKTGLIPEVIITPIGQASRMTMATVVEGQIARGAAMMGDRSNLAVDTQDFCDRDAKRRKVKTVSDHFVQKGWRRDGSVTLVDGRTGEQMRGDAFLGIIKYERLMHLAANKINFCAEGPRDPLTRAPKQGKRRRGGLRFGEMEEAAALAQGAAYLIQSRLRDLSDPFEIFVCSQCQHMCDGNKLTNYAWCTACERRDTVHIVRVPFAFVLHQYELMALGVKIRMGIRPTKAIINIESSLHAPRSASTPSEHRSKVEEVTEDDMRTKLTKAPKRTTPKNTSEESTMEKMEQMEKMETRIAIPTRV